MANQADGKGKPGTNPVLLVVGGIVVIGGSILLLNPGLLDGPQGPAAASGGYVNPAEQPVVVTQAQPTGSPSGIEIDPYASFMVSFGRANPFAPLRAAAGNSFTNQGKNGPVSPQTPSPRSTPDNTGPTLEEMRNRLDELKKKSGAGLAAEATPEVSPVPTSAPEQNLTADRSPSPSATVLPSPAPGPRPAGELFVLKGIVHSADKAVAVIDMNGKTYIVGAGGRIGMTGFFVRSIGGDRAVIASAEKEMVLVLGGKK